MSLEEKANKLRDKFNFLVKQYKKYEKKKNTEEFVPEKEEVKNLLSLFFKEYGNFIRTRKNSLGTFDYEAYLGYLKKEGGVFRGRSTEDKKYGELYNKEEGDREDGVYKGSYKEDSVYKGSYKEDGVYDNTSHKGVFTTLNPPFYPSQDEFIRSNRIEYKRVCPPGGKYPKRQFHTDFVSGYYKEEYLSPLVSRSPSLNLYSPGEGVRNQQGGFYEKYVNKKVTVYDFIRESVGDTKRVVDNTHNHTHSHTHNHLRDGVKIDRTTSTKYPSPTTLPPPISPSPTTTLPPLDKKLYKATPYNLMNIPVLPQVNNIYSPPSRHPPGFVQFPEYRPLIPLQYGNTPLWKNQFVNMDTSKLQGRIVTPHTLVGQPVRRNTYNTLRTKPPTKGKGKGKGGVGGNRDIGRDVHKDISRDVHKDISRDVHKDIGRDVQSPLSTTLHKKFKFNDLSPSILSSSTSEDYQKYFLEDLLKEAGCLSLLSQDSTNFLYGVCDNLFEHFILMSCALTLNNKKKTVTPRDVKLILKMEFGIELPEENDTLEKSNSLEKSNTLEKNNSLEM